jgi:hypothetical protein
MNPADPNRNDEAPHRSNATLSNRQTGTDGVTSAVRKRRKKNDSERQGRTT